MLSQLWTVMRKNFPFTAKFTVAVMTAIINRGASRGSQLNSLYRWATWRAFFLLEILGTATLKVWVKIRCQRDGYRQSRWFTPLLRASTKTISDCKICWQESFKASKYRTRITKAKKKEFAPPPCHMAKSFKLMPFSCLTAGKLLHKRHSHLTYRNVFKWTTHRYFYMFTFSLSLLFSTFISLYLPLSFHASSLVSATANV